LNRGDVAKAELPRPRGQASHEQHGYRRAVIIQDQSQHANLSTVVIVPTTSNLNAATYGNSFIVNPSTLNGLDCDSTLLVHQIRALDRRRIKQVIGQLSEDDLRQLEESLRRLLSL